MNRKKNKQPKLKIKKGDRVQVISGVSKGVEGKVLEVLLKKRKAIVEKVNVVSKATKPNQENTEGGIIKKEAPIHISNLMLIDPKGGGVTRVGRRRNKDGKIERYAKKSGEVIK
jgi:large subunit ribosomal protein L24